MKTDMGAAAEMALERTTRPRSQSHADATDDLSPLHRLTDDERSTFRSCSSLPDAQVRQTADRLLSHPLNNYFSFPFSKYVAPVVFSKMNLSVILIKVLEIHLLL